MCRPVLLLCAVASLFLLSGCPSPAELGSVEGTVIINGQPGDQLRLEFHPDATKGTDGPSSFAKTDEQGHFKLAGPVAVGSHKVVVRDMRLAQSETGRGVQPRFGPEYATVLKTPLDV